ncbi:MAG: T9SS type A sorting domain-containing protein [Prevotella sp.]|nr:T9SS type A sorting domain-containing protein [Prevotella sp.]
MKQFYLSACMAIALLGQSIGGNAKDIFLSSTGNDTNDGLTASTAYATLQKAMGNVADGDIVYVSGMIKVSSEISREGGTVTFVGSGDKGESGFDGNGTNRIFSTVNASLSFRNLTVMNCKAQGTGGALYLQGGKLFVDNCVLSNNATNCQNGSTGGAIRGHNCNIEIYNSEFYNNKGQMGGAIELRGGNIAVFSTSFTNNHAASATSGVWDGGVAGGALSLVDVGTSKFQYCTIENNVSDAHAGAFNIAGGSTRTVQILSCSVIGNIAGGTDGTYAAGNDVLANGRHKAHGGAFMVTFPGTDNGKGETTCKMIIASTTIANNYCGQAGGVMLFSGNGLNGQELDLVNCTITKNETADNIGNSGGFAMQDKKVKLNIINTILEGNWAIGNNRWSDGWFKTTPVTVKNSVVGFIFENDQYTYDIDPSSYWITTPDGSTTSLTSGIDPQMECSAHCFPLQPNSKGTTMGDNAMAATYGVTVDQKGQPLTKPYIGALQSLIGENIPEIPSTPTKILNLAGNADGSLSFGVQGNKIVAAKNAKVEIFSLSGQKMADYIGSQTTALPNGSYVVRVSGNGKSVSRKVILK